MFNSHHYRGVEALLPLLLLALVAVSNAADPCYNVRKPLSSFCGFVISAPMDTLGTDGHDTFTLSLS